MERPTGRPGPRTGQIPTTYAPKQGKKNPDGKPVGVEPLSKENLWIKGEESYKSLTSATLGSLFAPTTPSRLPTPGILSPAPVRCPRPSGRRWLRTSCLVQKQSMCHRPEFNARRVFGVTHHETRHSMRFGRAAIVRCAILDPATQCFDFANPNAPRPRSMSSFAASHNFDVRHRSMKRQLFFSRRIKFGIT